MATIGNSATAITLAPGQTTIEGTVSGSAPAYAGFYAAVYGPGISNDEVIVTGAVENTASGRLDAGIVLGASGEVINQGLISGGAGIVIGGYGAESYIRNANRINAATGNGITTYGKASVNNAGAIRAGGAGVDLRGGGILGNYGKITAAVGAELATYYGTGSIKNSGIILGTLGDGAILAGTLTNYAGATIAGSAAGLYAYLGGAARNAGLIDGGTIGIAINGPAAAASLATGIENTGTIFGAAVGIQLLGTASATIEISNGAHGRIVGGTYAVDVVNPTGPAVDLNNAGFINGGVHLRDGVIYNTGGLYGPTTAAYLDSGYIGNGNRLSGGTFGVISQGETLETLTVSGTIYKTLITGAITLTNTGYISGGSIAVDLLTGGVIRNNGGIITSAGTAIASGAGNGVRLINRGHVDGATTGVAINGNGYIYNSGQISAGGNAVSASGTAVITNYGLIQSTSAAAIAASPGSAIYNYGKIAGGLTQAAGSYLYNTGTIIAGATAGLTLDGTIAGTGGVIKLGAGPDIIGGFIGAGQKVQFSGTGETLDLGVNLTDGYVFRAKIAHFVAGETIDLTGIAFADITADTFSGGMLKLSESTGDIKLAFASPGSLAADTFALFADGAGTGITLTGAVAAHALTPASYAPRHDRAVAPVAASKIEGGWVTHEINFGSLTQLPLITIS